MGNTKFTELPTATAVSDTDILPVVIDPTDTRVPKKISFANLQKSITKLSDGIATGLLKITAGVLSQASAGTDYVAPNGNLTSLAALATNGLIARTAANTLTARSIAVSGNLLSLSNADASGGNPTIGLSIPDRIVFTIGDGTNVITTGIKKSLLVPFACTITGWTLLADDASTTPGALVIDIWNNTYANFPPLVANTIIPTGTKPTITATTTKGQSVSVTGWNVTINANDILRFNVDSVTAIKSATLILSVTRS